MSFEFSYRIAKLSLRGLLRWMKSIGLHLAIVISLLWQLGNPILTAKPAIATTPSAANVTAAAPPLIVTTTKLEESLRQLLEAGDGRRLDLLFAQIDQQWQELQTSATQSNATVLLQSANVQSLSASTALMVEQRVAESQQIHNQRFAALEQQYNALVVAKNQNFAVVRSVANSFLTAIDQALAPARPPKIDLDRLYNRSAPKTKPVQYLTQDLSNPGFASADSRIGEDLPTPADLVGTEDAAITPEIQKLADELGNDPVKIFAYVYNNISYEPYYGSRKGSLLTLWERSGNDFDIASLLIALLRASEVSARYAHGEAIFEGNAARNWVGNAADLSIAGSLFASGGVPATVLNNKDLIIEHVWVEIYTDLKPQSPNEKIFLPLIFRGLSNIQSSQLAQIDALESNHQFQPTPAQESSKAASQWVALDASFKQYTFANPTDLSAITGFDAQNYIDQVRATTEISDSVQAIYQVPSLPSADQPDNRDFNLNFAEAKVASAISKTIDYISKTNDIDNVALFGGAYVIKRNFPGLPDTLPFTAFPDQPITRYSELPATLRDAIQIEINSSFGSQLLSYKASYASLANQRITISYEAATANDQEVIDNNGGSLLTTPPVVDLIPVLRLNGTEVARGNSSARMGTNQIRSLTFIDAGGNSTTVQNYVSVGETFAVGLAYGRMSSTQIAAAQARLAAARAALPTNSNGDPDINATQNMGEPVVGEMLHLSLLAYFNQLDVFSEMVARSQNLHWYRYLSAGVAMQSLAFGYGFGGPVQTYGGGMGFDIQQNVVVNIALDGDTKKEINFQKTTGYFGSALEHSLFENVGKGAVSSIRLLSLALDNDIPVYRISSENLAAVLPKLQLPAAVESDIVSSVNDGKVVTVSEQQIQVNDWQGVGYIVLDPTTGSAGYLIYGGLAGNLRLTAGGSLWDILKTIGAYAWLAINMGLDLWGVWAGIGLLLVPEPTLLTKLAGIALIAGSLASLGFDVADLMGLVSGDISASQYIQEQITGLIVEAILKRVGIAAAAEIIRRIGPDAVEKVIRPLSELTNGASDRLLSKGFADNELADLSQRLTTREAWESVANANDRFGSDVTRNLLNNDYINSKGATQRISDLLNDVPNATGLEDTVSKAVSRGDFGYPYELQRAAAHAKAGDTITDYGKRVDVTFERITGFDANGNPIRGGFDTQPLEGDVVLSGDRFIDAKHGAHGNQDVHIWNQIVKAQEAINTGKISEFTFESSSSMGQKMRDWAAQNAPDVKFVTNLGDGFP